MRILLSITFLTMFLTIFVDWKKEKGEYQAISGTIFPTVNSQNTNEKELQVKSEVIRIEQPERSPANSPQQTTVINKDREKIAGQRKTAASVSKPIEQLQKEKSEVDESVPLVKSPEPLKSEHMTKKTPAPDLPNRSETPKTPVSLPVQTVEPQQDFVSFHTLFNAVKNSNSSYYFSGRNLTQKNVTVEVLSLTPFRDKEILRFKIQNDQQEYFFVANISLYDEKKLLSAQFFFEPLVAPGKSMDCIALIQRTARAQLSLTVIESSGKNRTFELKFVTL